MSAAISLNIITWATICQNTNNLKTVNANYFSSNLQHLYILLLPQQDSH